MKRLFPELESPEVEMASEYDAYKLVSGSENCENMFHFYMTTDQDNYVIAESSGGSNGAMMIELTKLENGEFVTISSFETQNSGYGRVIQHGKGFYYVFIEYNYVSKNVYMTTDGASLNTYLEGIKGHITSDTYLENGLAKDIDVFCGDEIEDKDFGVPSVDECYFSNHYYKTDFTLSPKETLDFLLPIPYTNHNRTRHASGFTMRNPAGLFFEGGACDEPLSKTNTDNPTATQILY